MTATIVGLDAVSPGSLATVSVTLPAGISDGDLGVLTVVYNPTNGDTATPAGWFQFGEHSFSASMKSRLYSRTMLATDSSTVVSLVHPSANKMSAAFAVLTGVDPGGFTFAVLSGDDSGPITSRADGVSVAFWLQRGGTIPTSITAPTGYTLGDAEFGTGGGQTCAAVATNLTPSSSQGGTPWTPDVANAGTITWTVATSLSPDPAPDWQIIERVGGVSTVLSAIERVGGVSTPVTIYQAVSPVQALTYPAYAAHRGGANVGQRVENTLDAFTQSVANDHPDTLLEMDVCLLGAGGGATLEDRIALTHESSDLSADGKITEADGVTVVTGTASSKTVAEWDTYLVKPRTGIAGTAKPASRWSQVVDLLLANPTKIAMPEMKTDDVVDPLIDSILANGLQGRVIVQSFEYSRVLAAAAAGLHTCWLTASFSTTSAAAAAAAGIEAVGFERTNPNLAALCDEAHAAGLKTWVYTVNSTINRDAAASAGADGFFTDVPTVVNN